MSAPDTPELVWRTGTCHTEECRNVGVAIRLQVPVDSADWYCGACGQPITDVADAPSAGEPTTEGNDQ